MPTPTEWLNEFQVNTGTAATGTQSKPKIIGLANGNFVVAWEESTDGLIGTASGTDIVAKIYNAEGNVLRDAFQLNQFRTTDDERDFDLAATHDGFVVTYLDNDTTNPDATSVVFERFDSDGDRKVDAGSAFQIAQERTASDFLRNPQIAANLKPVNDDVFIGFDERIGADIDINARVINQDGHLGAKFDAAQNSLDSDRLGDSAILSNGNFVTVYEEGDAALVSLEFSIRTPAGGSVLRAGAVANDGSNPSVASFDDRNGFVVTYESNGNVFAKLFQPSGQLIRTIDVATGSADQTEPVVVTLPGGGFVVAWNDETNGTLLARKFLSDGTAVADIFTVEDTNTRQTDISVTGDGRVLIAWVGANDEVFASIWDPRDRVIFAEEFIDRSPNSLKSNLITTSRDVGSTVDVGTPDRFDLPRLTVLGQDGDDTISSTGHGSYFGGAGDDTVIAGQFTGSDNFELLNGGAGTDTLNTAKFGGNYTVNLATGETNYRGRPETPVESFINFENIVSGRGDDTITGTDVDNTIDSGPGSDTIDAGGGDDTIFARSGNDTILASPGGDLIFAGEGNDTITTSGPDAVHAEAGNDTVILGDSTELFADGGSGVDRMDASVSTASFRINLGTFATGVEGMRFVNFENLMTGAGDDVIIGTDDTNLIDSGAGDDRVFGRGGDDGLIGGDGDDILFGEDGNDILRGGSGNDRLYGGDGHDEMYGQTGDDLMIGKAGGDSLVGGLGSDILIGGAGRDFLTGGDDDDELYGGVDSDNLDAGEGNDLLYGGDGDDFLAAYGGDDVLKGGNGDDTLAGGLGNDRIFGGTGADEIFGGAGDDVIVGREGNDTVDGGAGNDIILGNFKQDRLSGGAGDDAIFGGDGRDYLYGNEGNDRLYGGQNLDIIYGGEGDDFIFGNDDNDLLYGGDGKDTLYGQQGIDSLRGEEGDDILFGGDGDDRLSGNSGADMLWGGAGNDILYGGSGSDILRGGLGDDTFEFNEVSDSTRLAADVIKDIEGVGSAGGDVIDLSVIDANVTGLNYVNDSFTFLGVKTREEGLAFGAGALWLEDFGGQTRVFGLDDNDGAVDFALWIADGDRFDVDDYLASDFIL
ncbi:iron-regulated protein FrpC [Roseobacter denitrificans]|uniref:calcium-binding protein n=1 Tax=Roseobacter denitrificans TaxID=2434 RepID=UPI0002E788B9|nr:calcium-binding protein [Roseobacter denitrificans]AVL53687.1 iron-regulated protein FrpC [Roseobacter denitrificans]SFF73921.1 Ca2+-binding protein, RTX toxin-related [Roseobacter denitrificans OCh 114]